MSWEEIEDEDERFNAWDHNQSDEVIVEHKGVRVYYVIDQGCNMQSWYSIGGEEFDIREMEKCVGAPIADSDGAASVPEGTLTHEQAITKLIDLGILTEDGIEEPLEAADGK